MTRFLFGWLIWEQTESFFWIGIASAGMLLPSLIITPIFGVISDRINLKTGVIYWLLCQGTITLISAAVLNFWDVSLVILLLLSFIFGCVAAAGSPLRLTLTPQLVSKSELPNAVGLGAIVFNSSRIVAPAIAAWCLTFMSPAGVFILCTGFFFAAGGFNVLLPNLKSSRAASTDNHWQDFVSGLKFCWSMPLIKLLFLLTLINSQVARSLLELLPAISGTITDGTAADLAMLTACAGAGSIVGGMYISRQRGDTQNLMRLLTIAMLFTSLAIFPMMFSLPTWPNAVLIGCISLLMTLTGTGSQILLQIHTEDAVRGRVMSLWLTIAIAGPAFGSLIMGTLAEFLGLPVMLTAMLLLSLFGAYWLKGTSIKSKYLRHSGWGQNDISPR